MSVNVCVPSSSGDDQTTDFGQEYLLRKPYILDKRRAVNLNLTRKRPQPLKIRINESYRLKTQEFSFPVHVSLQTDDHI